MTDTTDAVIGAVPGLLAVGIMANVASKMMKGPGKIKSSGKTLKMQRQKDLIKRDTKKIAW